MFIIRLLESFITCRLIPLNKNPELRPIAAGQVLRGIFGKAVMMINKPDLMKAVGSLQICIGQEVVTELAIHAVHDIFNDQNTEAVYLSMLKNAFNEINMKAMLHNISVICPIISTSINNCYKAPAYLFDIIRREMLSKEGPDQEDLMAVVSYAIGVATLICHLLEITHSSANRMTLETASVVFANTKINITEDMRHLRAVIGSHHFEENYVNDLVANLNILSKKSCYHSYHRRSTLFQQRKLTIIFTNLFCHIEQNIVSQIFKNRR